jgi:D-alanyl-D-alanine carboxypeptidase
MNDTHYVNPHGLLDPGHYSSAHDLALIGRVALTNSTIKQISGTLKMTVPTNKDHPGRLMINGDQFLWWYPGVDSGKPGFDGQNNHVQVISCIRNNRHLIGVLIVANNYYTDMRTLLNYGFDLYDWQSPAIVDQKHPIPFDYDDNYFSSDTQDGSMSTANGGRYYYFTGYSISGQIMSYFDNNSGLKKFGFPRSQAIPVSDVVIKQRFDHGTIQCNLKTKQCSLT